MSLMIHGDVGDAYGEIGGWIREPAELKEPEDGFDELTRHLVVSAANIAAAKALFTKGSPDSEETSMFLSQVNPRDFLPGSGFVECDIVFKGLSRDKPGKWKWITLSERNSYKSIIFAGYLSTYGAGDVAEPRVGAVVRYVTTTEPDMSVVGTQLDPDNEPAVPGSLWDLIPDKIVNIPKEWVLDSRNPDQVAGASVWLVEDTFSFYQAVKPAK
jgi:hypothetical protein